MEENYWVSSILVLGMGYLFYNLGYNIKNRNIVNVIFSIRSLLYIIGLILFLCLLLLLN
jgi:hypothetical protein